MLTTADLQLRQVPESLLEQLVVELGGYHVGSDERRSGRQGALARALARELDNKFSELAARAALPSDAPVCGYCKESPGLNKCRREGCEERPHHYCFIDYCEQRALHQLADVPQPGYCPHHASLLHDD